MKQIFNEPSSAGQSTKENKMKNAYQSPRLVQYGGISKLTQGSGGSRVDANNNVKN